MNKWLNIKDLEFKYGYRSVLKNLSFSVGEETRVLAIIGSSGIGKSTLLSLIAGHLRPRKGKIEVCGENVYRPSSSRPLVFQENNLFPWMTVLNNVVFGLKCKGIPKIQREQRGTELLHMMGLDDTLDLYPDVLSGGMRQKVGIARAIAIDPKCILMDEPFQSIDPQSRQILQDEIAQMISKHQFRAIVVTHNLNEASKMADQILILQNNNNFKLVNSSNF